MNSEITSIIEKLLAEGKTTKEIVAQVTEALSGSTGKPKYSCICAMPVNEAETAIRKRYSTPAEQCAALSFYYSLEDLRSKSTDPLPYDICGDDKTLDDYVDVSTKSVESLYNALNIVNSLGAIFHSEEG